MGKEIARQNQNFREGRPKKYTKIQVDYALKLLSEGMSYREVVAISGISKSTLIRSKQKK